LDREVIGEFQASFYLDSISHPAQGTSDSIIITNGYFETTIQER